MRLFTASIFVLLQCCVYGKRYYLMRLPNGGFSQTDDQVLAPAPPPPPKSIFSQSQSFIKPPVENAPVVHFGQSLPVAPVHSHSAGPTLQGAYPPHNPQPQSQGGYPPQQQSAHGHGQQQQSAHGHGQQQQSAHGHGQQQQSAHGHGQQQQSSGAYPPRQQEVSQGGYPPQQEISSHGHGSSAHQQSGGYPSQQQPSGASQGGYPPVSNSASTSKQIPIAAIAIISGAGKSPIDPTQVKQSEGTCEFDAECWHVKPQVAIANGVMFDRTTGSTCEDCLGKCQQFQSADSPWICRAVTYDHRWQICDLFAVTGHEKPQFLTDYYGRDYFTPKGDSCSAAPSECEADDLGREQVSVFCKWQDSAVKGTETLDATEEEWCVDACNKKGAKCKGFTFDGSKCLLVEEVLQNGEFPPLAVGSGYFEKACLPKELVKDPEELYDIIPNYILVGHVQEVTDAKSLRECKLQCLQALEFFGFECKSAMYYPTDPDQNCLLNSETRCTQANVFIPEDQGVQMVYFDVGAKCRARKVTNRRKSLFLARDDPLPMDSEEDLNVVTSKKWTNWTRCSTDKLFRNRYLKCKEKDVRKCPKQTLRCSEAEKSIPSLRNFRRRLTLPKHL